MKHQSFKSDKFRKARGGHSRFLKIACAKCGAQVCFYQKDGSGILKRMYLDRMIGFEPRDLSASRHLSCAGCREPLGVPIIYKKERRPACRLFVGAVTKKIVRAREVPA